MARNMNSLPSVRRSSQASKDVVERQQGATSDLNDDRLLRFGQDGASRLARAHGGVRRARSGAPLGDRLRVQPVAGGQGAGARLRRLELGSNTRRRSG